MPECCVRVMARDGDTIEADLVRVGFRHAGPEITSCVGSAEDDRKEARSAFRSADQVNGIVTIATFDASRLSVFCLNALIAYE